MRKLLGVVATGLIVLAPTQASAQWTFDPGYVPGIMGPVVTDPCTGGRCDAEPRPSRKENLAIGSAIYRSLSGELPQATDRDIQRLAFTASQQRRNANVESFIARTPRAHRADAERLRAINADGRLFAAMDQALSQHGLSTSNLADAYATWWMMAYDGANARTQDPTTQQVQGVRRQAAAALLGVSAIAELSPVERQEMADALLIQAFIIASLINDAKSNPSSWPQVQRAVRSGASRSGLNLDAMRLTRTGFAAN